MDHFFLNCATDSTKKNQIHGGLVGLAVEDEKIQTDLIDYFIHCNQFKCHRQTKLFFEQFPKLFQDIEKNRKFLINNKWGWNWWGCTLEKMDKQLAHDTLNNGLRPAIGFIKTCK